MISINAIQKYPDIPNGQNMSNQRQFDVDITFILRRPNFDEFHVISTYFYDITSLIKKSTSFQSTFFYLISMVRKSTLFPHTFCGVISLVEKYTFFPRTFLDVISLVEISTFFHVLFSM